ncbi:hypothetical protein DACRYDRAFT_48717 [Dacryopinax primogenitus]|uniref:Uncharacterized protein n=1 Tax=Dacryopinax primogenitus (strain DJM 731) TaxID=1858805 RepID=M5GCZ4_DACPD|nr:uncharacterized protein DACRYDRAFT_48717 [Dacryopinax primogenitus]EJU04142.1 hypothetical protein DACRYDRAFT_48717 [Dacryopinax primogenitus]
MVGAPHLDAGRTVYYYTNPMNGATITSFLPPDHPRSLCLQQGHVPMTTHGVLGILAAIFFFPIGVVCCMIDRRSVCARCGEVLSDGCM